MPTPITFDQLLDRAFPQRGIEVRYGPKQGEFARLHLPSATPTPPVAVVIHGGCWGTIAGPEYMAPLAEWLTGIGWAAWRIGFPRLGEPGATG